MLKPTKPLATMLFLLLSGTAFAGPLVEMFKNPYCGCCEKWAAHMKSKGFDVNVVETTDGPAKRHALGMPDSVASCHTSKVGDYVLEGHVPAEDVQRLLKEAPKALGLAVAGMPPGSPGMGETGPAYSTLLVQKDGSTSVFAKH